MIGIGGVGQFDGAGESFSESGILRFNDCGKRFRPKPANQRDRQPSDGDGATDAHPGGQEHSAPPPRQVEPGVGEQGRTRRQGQSEKQQGDAAQGLEPPNAAGQGSQLLAQTRR